MGKPEAGDIASPALRTTPIPAPTPAPTPVPIPTPVATPTPLTREAAQVLDAVIVEGVDMLQRSTTLTTEEIKNYEKRLSDLLESGNYDDEIKKNVDDFLNKTGEEAKNADEYLKGRLSSVIDSSAYVPPTLEDIETEEPRTAMSDDENIRTSADDTEGKPLGAPTGEDALRTPIVIPEEYSPQPFTVPEPKIDDFAEDFKLLDVPEEYTAQEFKYEGEELPEPKEVQQPDRAVYNLDAQFSDVELGSKIQEFSTALEKNKEERDELSAKKTKLSEEIEQLQKQKGEELGSYTTLNNKAKELEGFEADKKKQEKKIGNVKKEISDLIQLQEKEKRLASYDRELIDLEKVAIGKPKEKSLVANAVSFGSFLFNGCEITIEQEVKSYEDSLAQMKKNGMSTVELENKKNEFQKQLDEKKEQYRQKLEKEELDRLRSIDVEVENEPVKPVASETAETGKPENTESKPSNDLEKLRQLLDEKKLTAEEKLDLSNSITEEYTSANEKLANTLKELKGSDAAKAILAKAKNATDIASMAQALQSDTTDTGKKLYQAFSENPKGFFDSLKSTSGDDVASLSRKMQSNSLVKQPSKSTVFKAEFMDDLSNKGDWAVTGVQAAGTIAMAAYQEYQATGKVGEATIDATVVGSMEAVRGKLGGDLASGIARAAMAGSKMGGSGWGAFIGAAAGALGGYLGTKLLGKVGTEIVKD